MSKFGQYNINLLEITDKVQLFQYTLDEAYFAKIDSEEVAKGEVQASVQVVKRAGSYELAFRLEGAVKVPCDRCLDDMDQPIVYEETVFVKLGENYSEENDVVIVPALEGSINIAWFLYEFIILNIPIKHVHPYGECNKTMVSKLKRHITHQKGDLEDEGVFDDGEHEHDNDVEDLHVEDEQIDPRWKALQDIKFENN